MTTEELKVVISAEMEKFVSAIKDVIQALKDIEKAVSGTSDKVDSETKKTEKSVKTLGEEIKDLGDNEGFKTLADGAKASLAVVAGAVIAVGATLLSLGESTMDYRNEMAKLNSAFEATGKTTQSAKSAYKELYSVIGETDQAVEASQQIALLAKSEEEVAKWAELGAGVVATFGDALQPETFYEAANETAKLGEATGAYVQMLEGAGVNVDDFNKKLASCNTEAERNALILDTAEEVLGEAGEAYRKTAEEIINYRKSQERLNEANAKLGEAMTPVNTAFNDFKATLAEKLAPIVEDFVDNHLEDLKSGLGEIADKVGTVITFISDNWAILEPLVVLLGTLALSITAISIALGIYSTVMGIATVVTSPILIVILALIATVALLIIYIEDITDAFQEFAEKASETIGTWAQNAKDKFNEFKQKTGETIKQFKEDAIKKFNEVKTNITNRVNEIKSNVVSKISEMKSNAVSRVSELAGNITGKFESIRSTIQTKLEDAKSLVKGAVDDFLSYFDFEWSLPDVKVPSFSVKGGSWPYGLGGKGTFPSISVNWNALGGVFDKPTLFNYGGSLQGIGEDGAEAVVPLEKNTQWLDRIAERLQGNGTPIVIQVDGKVFAETAINTINANTKQTGKLNLIYT